MPFDDILAIVRRKQIPGRNITVRPHALAV